MALFIKKALFLYPQHFFNKKDMHKNTAGLNMYMSEKSFLKTKQTLNKDLKFDQWGNYTQTTHKMFTLVHLIA